MRSIYLSVLQFILVLFSMHAAEPTNCVTGEFSSTGDQYYRSIVLKLTNNCGSAVDLQDVSITFQNKTNLNTPFWGDFSPLDYPDNTLQIASQPSGTVFLSSFKLHFPQQSAKSSILPPDQSIFIRFGAASDQFIKGTVNVYLGGIQVDQKASLGITLPPLPSELAGYTGKPTVIVTEQGSTSSTSVQLNWNTTTRVKQLKSNAKYTFSTPVINYNGLQWTPTFSPVSVIAKASFVPATTLTYVGSVPPVNSGTPVALNGQLKVIGTQLCNEQGTPIQLKGMSSHGLQWYKGCVNTDSMSALANDFKADVFRLALYVQEGGYETNPAGFTQTMNDLIEIVSDLGMYVIIDWHILTPGDPNYNFERAKTFFTNIATANKGRNNLLYEICNEPNGVNWSDIKSYADKLIPIIRAIDPNTVILVGTPGWSSLGMSEGNGPSEIINNKVNFSNVMYTFHFYAASHRDEYLNALDFATNSIPVFTTEFGMQTYDGDGANDFAMTDRYMDLMARKKISWTNWNFSDDFRSGPIWKEGTCPNGPWIDANLKPSGIYIKKELLE